MVDIHSDRYRIATAYMLRLTREDFDTPAELANLAAAAKMSPAAFRSEFGHLVEHAPAHADSAVLDGGAA